MWVWTSIFMRASSAVYLAWRECKEGNREKGVGSRGRMRERKCDQESFPSLLPTPFSLFPLQPHPNTQTAATGAGGCITVPHFLQVRTSSSDQKASNTGFNCVVMSVSCR